MQNKLTQRTNLFALMLYHDLEVEELGYARRRPLLFIGSINLSSVNHEARSCLFPCRLCRCFLAGEDLEQHYWIASIEGHLGAGGGMFKDTLSRSD